MTKKLTIGVLLSGSGSNLEAILDACENDDLPVRVAVVVASRPDAYGITRAQQHDIPTLVMNKERYANPLEADTLIVKILQHHHVEYVVMAGYMRKLTHVLLNAFPQRVLNIHPALLPAFPGAHAIREAFDAGVKVTGVTIHFANEVYDEGPIIAQHALDVRQDETFEMLEARIHSVEHVLYPQVLRLLATHDMVITGKKVCVYPKSDAAGSGVSA